MCVCSCTYSGMCVHVCMCECMCAYQLTSFPGSPLPPDSPGVPGSPLSPGRPWGSIKAWFLAIAQIMQHVASLRICTEKKPPLYLQSAALSTNVLARNIHLSMVDLNAMHN